MTIKKHYIFSARTTEAGLRTLNELKAEQGIGWDELIIEAVSSHYEIDRDLLTLPKTESKPKQEKPANEKPKRKKSKGNKQTEVEVGEINTEISEVGDGS